MIQASFLDSVLNPLLSPLLNLGVFWAIAIISIVLTLIITLIYKLVTNQKVLKELKEDQKRLQKEMKGLRDKPDKMMKKQKEVMSKNMEYMKHSLKATLFTIIPVIIIFGWLTTHVAYEPIIADEPFNVTLLLSVVPEYPPEVELPGGIQLLKGFPKKATNTVLYGFTADAGAYEAPPLRFKYEGELCEVPLIVEEAGGRDYSNPKIVCKDKISSATVSNEQVKPMGPVSIFGWKPGWFGTYIILSIVFSMIIRKLLKVY